MKKKSLLGVLMTSFACVALASCNKGYESTASKEVDFSKDFDLVKPEPLSSAKLLSQEEKMAYIEKNSNNDITTFIETAKEKYKTMVILTKVKCEHKDENSDTNTIETYTKQSYIKNVIDLKTGNTWYYEKSDITLLENSEKTNSSSFEVETKLVNKDGNYIVKSKLNLDNYVCFIEGGFTEYGNVESITSYFATGSSNVYTTIPSEGLALNFENNTIQNLLTRVTKWPGSWVSDKSTSMYIDEEKNYNYTTMNSDGLAYTIGIKSDNFIGIYQNMNNIEINEYLTEIYLSEKSIMNDEINTDDCIPYSVEDWNLNKTCSKLPLIALSTTSSTGADYNGWANIVNINSYVVPLSFYQDKFTIETKA